MIRRLLLSIVVIAVVAPVLSGDAAPPVLVARGVTLAGIPVSGMSYEQAQAAVAPAFAQPLRLAYGKTSWNVKARRFGSSVAVAEGVDRALGAKPDESVNLVPRVDEEVVRAYVNVLAKRFAVPARNAELVGLAGLTPKFSDAQTGVAVQRRLAAERIVKALESSRRPRVRVPVRAIAPEVTLASFGSVIVVRRGANELRLYNGKRLAQTFGVATGRSVYPTPTGHFSIADMQLNPWWRPPDSDWAKGLKPIPPGPGNPLGTRWMGLTAPGVGIHGTPDDASIGYSASHGCIRMHISDAEWLFQHVSVGTQVIITDA